jgi:hypothetical protein
MAVRCRHISWSMDGCRALRDVSAWPIDVGCPHTEKPVKAWPVRFA